MLRPVGRAARPSGSSPSRCWSGLRARRRSASSSPKSTSASPTTLTRAVMRSSLCRKLGGRQPAGQVGAKRVDPVGAGGGGDGGLVAFEAQGGFALQGGGGDVQQAAHLGAEDPRDH